MSLAPICLFVFNRPAHTKVTLDSLARNPLAKDSDLFVFADGPRGEKDLAKIKEVRSLISQEDRFKSVTLFASEQNKGLANSVIAGVSKIVNEFGKVIVMEDDLESSPHFLKFMNDALDLYANDQGVASITGYCFPVSGRLPETFFQKRISSWGWATWGRAWKEFRSDASELITELDTKNIRYAFDVDGTYAFYQMLVDQKNGLNSSWAIRFLASTYLKGMLTLYPGHSLIQNIGFDASGTHCAPTKEYEVKLATQAIRVERIPIQDDANVYKKMKRFYGKHRRFDQRVIRKLKKIFGVQ